MSSEQPKIAKAHYNPKQKALLLRVTVFFLLLAVCYFIYWVVYARHYVTTDNAYVSGNVIPVTSLVSGTIISVTVNDTSFVQEGQTLVLLDATDKKIAYAQAQANLALVIRQTEQYYIKDKGLQASIIEKELNLKQATTDYKRRQQAITIGGVSAEELNHAQDRFKIASSVLTTTQSDWKANKALINNVSLRDHPNVIQAIAQLREAYLNLVRTTIKAPVSGYVSKRAAQVGQMSAPGTFLMAIVPLSDVWVDANFKEKQLRAIGSGQPVTLTSDLYGSSVVYHGHVAGFSGGTGAAFSLLPAQNATGNWIKIVQRLPVRIEIDPTELKKNPLRIGLSMEVRVDTDTKKKPLVAVISKTANDTAIFNDLDKGLDAVVAKIFSDNVQLKSDDIAPIMPTAGQKP